MVIQMKKTFKTLLYCGIAFPICLFTYSFTSAAITDNTIEKSGSEGISTADTEEDMFQDAASNTEEGMSEGAGMSDPGRGASMGLASSEFPDPVEFDFSSGEPVTILDNEYCSITLTYMEMQDNDFWSDYATGLTIDNKTDIPLSFTISHCSVNKKMCHPFWFENVEPLSTLDTVIEIKDFELINSYITDITDFMFTVTCSDANNTPDDLFVSTFDLYPLGFEADNTFAPENDDIFVVLDNDVCTITVIDITENEISYDIKIRIDNKSDSNLILLPTEKTTINGTEIRPFFNCIIDKGKSCYSAFSWYGLSEIGIETIEDVEIGLDILDADNWFADLYYSDVFTVKTN